MGNILLILNFILLLFIIISFIVLIFVCKKKFSSFKEGIDDNFHNQSNELDRRIKEIKNQIISIKEKNQEIYDKEVFEPYMAMIVKDTDIYSKNKEKTGVVISKNNFQTIIFEKDGLCELLSGAGWIKKDCISKDFHKTPVKKIAKVLQRTSLKNGPSLGYHNITFIEKEQIVEVINTYGAWAKVKFYDSEGFVLLSLLKIESQKT